MPVIINGNEYKFLYLDTNAISELVYNKNNIFRNIMIRFLSSNYVITFSIYNVLELKNGYSERYMKFLEVFSKIPCIMFLTYKDIVKEEVEVHNGKQHDITQISYSFVPEMSSNAYSIEYCLNIWIDKLENILKTEKRNMDELAEFFTIQKDGGNQYTNFDAQYEEEVTKDFLNELKYSLTGNFDIQKLPSCRIINRSVYNRIAKGKNDALGINDIYDIMISSALPYVDAIITERYQLEVIKQSKSIISQLKKLECYKVSDFYDKNNE